MPESISLIVTCHIYTFVIQNLIKLKKNYWPFDRDSCHVLTLTCPWPWHIESVIDSKVTGFSESCPFNSLNRVVWIGNQWSFISTFVVGTANKTYRVSKYLLFFSTTWRLKPNNCQRRINTACCIMHRAQLLLMYSALYQCFVIWRERLVPQPGIRKHRQV